MTLVASSNNWFVSIDYKLIDHRYSEFVDEILSYDEYVILSESVLLTIGTSLQIIPYATLSVRRTIISFWKRFRPKKKNKLMFCMLYLKVTNFPTNLQIYKFIHINNSVSITILYILLSFCMLYETNLLNILFCSIVTFFITKWFKKRYMRRGV